MNFIPPLPKRIGLMADSHDHLEAFKSAIGILKDRGAASLVHLGDLCDSLRPDLLEESIKLVQKNHIYAVKGNNDFCLEKTLLTHREMTDNKIAEHIAFLQDLPMKIAWDSICFAHSLPFNYYRAFYEPIDMGSNERAEQIFTHTSQRILFCGHSHRSVLFRWNGGNPVRENIPLGESIPLSTEERYIIVTGSILENECAIFDTENWCLERIQIPVG